MDQLKPWENFILSILAFSGVPLLPLLIEFVISGAIAEKSLVLTSAIYSVGMFACTRKVTFIAICLLVSVVQMAIFGALSGENFQLGKLMYLTNMSIVFVFIAQIFERYKIHITDLKNFWGQ